MKTKLLILLFITCFLSNSWGQKKKNKVIDSGEIPFELVKNTIIIPLEINGKVYRFVLDTGGVLMISKKLQSAHQFETTESIIIQDFNKNEAELKRVIIPQIKIGQAEFLSHPAIIDEMSESYPSYCFGTDGLIGRDMFQDMLLYFDYSRKVIQLSNMASNFDLKAFSKSKLKLSDQGLPYVQLILEGKKQWIKFDSGSGDFFSYKSSDAAEQVARVKSDKLTFEGIFSYGMSKKDFNSTKRYRLKVDHLKIGSAEFNNFYSDFSKRSSSRIGAGILIYGKVLLDFRKKAFYYAPYNKVKMSTTYETFGFEIAKINGIHRVKWVLDGSEAEKMGLQYGQEVLSINGVKTSNFSDECESYLNGYEFMNEATIQLKVEEDNEIRTIQLKKKAYF